MWEDNGRSKEEHAIWEHLLWPSPAGNGRGWDRQEEMMGVDGKGTAVFML